MKKRKFGILFSILVILMVSAGIIACNLDADDEIVSGHRTGETGGSGEGWESWADGWVGYSKDNMPPPSHWNQIGENWYWPNPFQMIDGTIVTTKEQWGERYDEISKILQHYLYGYLPPTPESLTATTTYNNGGTSGQITISMTHQGRTATMSGSFTLPAAPGNTHVSGYSAPWPVAFGGNAADVARGYATMGVPSEGSAPAALFGTTRNNPGDLILTAWAAGRMIDAIELLTAVGQPLNGVIDPGKFTITGHSRGGKAAIVGAAWEPRIGVAAPSSSGALGVAPERFIRTVVRPQAGLDGHPGNPGGKGFYYMDAARGNGNTELPNHVLQYLVLGVPPPGFAREYGPIQSIQGYDHARWDSGGNFATGTLGTWPGARIAEFSRFNVDQFWTSENTYQGKGSMAQVPFDQHFLTSLMAGPDPDHPRAVIMSAGNDGDSWVHPEGTYITFLATREVYKFLEQQGVANATNLVAVVLDNTGGHVHSVMRRSKQMDLCDYVWRGKPLPANFMDKDADDSWYGQGAEYPLDIRSLDDYKLLNWAAPGEKSLAEIAVEFFETHTAYPTK
jgi:hypothetical protein